MRSYYETRPQYNNHCGQAAIAAVLDYHQKPLGRLGMPPWDQSAAIDEIVNEGFAPDVVGGVLGTSGGLIKNAFDHFGLTNTSCGYSGAADAGWDQCWASVQNWVHAGYPVPCCVDVGTLGGQYFAGHWLIVYAIDASNVTVANWTSPTIPVNTFLAAWACHWYPYGYNHCFVTGQ